MIRRRVRETPPAPEPTRVTHDRLVNWLEAVDQLVSIEPELTGLWAGHQFWFLLLGETEEIIQIRGRWSRTLPLESTRPTLMALNDWNRERIWPKSYVRAEAGRLVVYTEVSADLGAGINDEQLHQILAIGIEAGLGLFRAMDRQLPEVELN